MWGRQILREKIEEGVLAPQALHDFNGRTAGWVHAEVEQLQWLEETLAGSTADWSAAHTREEEEDGGACRALIQGIRDVVLVMLASWLDALLLCACGAAVLLAAVLL